MGVPLETIAMDMMIIKMCSVQYIADELSVPKCRRACLSFLDTSAKTTNLDNKDNQDLATYD